MLMKNKNKYANSYKAIIIIISFKFHFTMAIKKIIITSITTNPKY